jgi:DNA-binding transcriptional ArsR family regulator
MDHLSTIFSALADPTRRALLTQLRDGEATINELGAPHAISMASISRHVAVLERAGLVAKTRSAQWRRCRIDPAPLQQVDEWMIPYREFFATRLTRLEAQLGALPAETREPENDR